MKRATLQLFNRGQWWDAAELLFDKEQMAAPVTLAYFPDYMANCLSYEAIDSWACSVNAPVSIIPVEYPNWPALLDDLLPVGKSKEWWLKHLNLSRSNEFSQNYALLIHACMAPVGNLRIKEAATQPTFKSDKRFSLQDVVTLQHDFLEYANEHGAAVGGATGAGGVAPKLLLMVEEEEVYIDGDFAGKPLTATPYLTKFARNTRSKRDNDILRAEGIFYQALAKILAGTNIESIDVSRMMTFDHDGQVSLWLPRFDIEIINTLASRLGLESVYSIINAEPGSYQDHFFVMEAVWQKISRCTPMTSAEFAKQYVARDFLNQVFGNSDNHGRNISFLKQEGKIRFAPIYDFAPMKADPEMVTRLFKWGRGCESSGTVRFNKVAQELATFCEPEELMSYLNMLAVKLLPLKALLNELGCPMDILEFPAIGFDYIAQKLDNMGVQHG
ncbi:HipA domain-containing protein [Aliiglaciecola sp. CAU 1673]|uniref:HipA domain-containing protein n=1 Tax=Aliiglaciecola sp. CAU 1673 TaxID=3032595 RepID=UPI0023DA06EB|nr:HipA domain-containing protein [Aliiglaciecola sp. CAU 1673]MDF2177938.1 HipA domain-containing protein [Aliiglaciecola sp. CAU 1673]